MLYRDIMDFFSGLGLSRPIWEYFYLMRLGNDRFLWCQGFCGLGWDEGMDYGLMMVFGKRDGRKGECWIEK